MAFNFKNTIKHVMMKFELKQNVVAHAKEFIEQHAISQNELAKATGVNARYLIAMFRGAERLDDAKQTKINDKYYIRLANYIGFALEKQYWEVRPTDQLKSITSVLVDAKTNGETAVITGATGCGKTFTCKLFQRKYPQEVFIVTVGASDNLGDLLDKILEAINVQSIKRTKSARIRLINKTLLKLNEEGKEPVLIFDEAEYMKQPALAALKELYDNLNSVCALVLIGTEQLTDNIEKLKRRDKPGIPQLYRRIRYRIRPLPGIDRSFSLFLNGSYDKNLVKWLRSNCDNYGELHDVLVPALREADRTGDKLSVDFVKMTLGI